VHVLLGAQDGIAAVEAILFVGVVAFYFLIVRKVAEYAERKGYSFWLFVVLSLGLSVIVAALIASLLRDKSPAGRAGLPTPSKLPLL